MGRKSQAIFLESVAEHLVCANTSSELTVVIIFLTYRLSKKAVALPFMLDTACVLKCSLQKIIQLA